MSDWVRGGLAAEETVSGLSVRPQGGSGFSGAPVYPKREVQLASMSPFNAESEAADTTDTR